MSDPPLSAVVVGGGQAGLAVSHYLQQYGIQHLVFEAGRIGESWRTQRWDSFALNSPNELNVLPGDVYEGTNGLGFDSAGSFAAYLEGYAARFCLPVREQAQVLSVKKNAGRFHVMTSERGTPGDYTCTQVIVASGAMNRKKLPVFARNINQHVRQLHTGEYRNAACLPDGAILVVGSGQSGLQVAEDLLDAGRKVYLSTSAVGRVPRRYRGRDILHWLLSIGFYDVRTEEVTNPKDLEMRPPQVSGVGPHGRTHSLQSLARKGAVILGRLDDALGDSLALRADAASNVRFSDEISRKIKAMIEDFIVQHRLAVPAPEPDPDDEPDTDAACASPMTSLHLDSKDVRTIIWTTGFAGDFSYLKVPVLDSSGKPLHKGGLSRVKGMYFLGLPWLRKRKSGIICGIREDAEFIAGEVRRELLAM